MGKRGGTGGEGAADGRGVDSLLSRTSRSRAEEGLIRKEEHGGDGEWALASAGGDAQVGWGKILFGLGTEARGGETESA